MADRPRVRIAVLGAGLIGREHATRLLAEPGAELAAIVDPAEAGKTFATERGVAWFPAWGAIPPAALPDGAIVATPNPFHVEHGLGCIAAGVPVLIEKPLAEDVAGAERLVAAAEAAGVALLTGHHRRHNPMITRAREIIAAGRLGRIVAVQAQCWFYKPEAYFDVGWRREKGAGPVLLNLIHDIDTLRHLCGEIVAVQAADSNAVRGHEVEDTAVMLLRFASGALGTVGVSDTIVAPWSWELTTGENPSYPRTGESCYRIGGTQGSLSIPALDLWHYPGQRGWWERIERERVAHPEHDPLARQIRQFVAVIRGEEAPLVSGREGLATLRVIAAMKEAATSGRTVRPG